MAGHTKTSETDLSTYRKQLARIGFNSWLKRLSKNSTIIQSGGTFLPNQRLLLEKIYAYFAKDPKSVLVVSAPPASGKTHVICLVSTDLTKSGLKSAIVVTCRELKHDFTESLDKLISKETRPVVTNILEFMRNRSKYDVAILDESHNLRTSFELEDTIYTETDITDLAAQLSWLVYDEGGQIRNLTKVIEGEDKESVLKIASKSDGHKWLRPTYRARSNWLTAISAYSNLIKLHLLIADPEARAITAKGSTILVSATPLSDEELRLYCGIEASDICREVITSEISASLCPYLAPNERLSEDVVFALVSKLLLKYPCRTLILANKRDTVSEWLGKLQETALKSRLVDTIGGQGPNKREEKFKEFMSQEDGILLTNSTVYWEGMNIKRLKRLLIILEPPNPRPNIVDVFNDRHTPYGVVMHDRMIQGIGRIGRNPTESGTCLILFPFDEPRISKFDCDDLTSVDGVIHQIVPRRTL